MKTAAALPTIAIIGRPNVGKSLLFNRLIGKPRSLVHHQAGMTLDFLQARLTNGEHHAELIDTGGTEGEGDEWSPIITAQMQRACDIADYFLLVVDAKTGLIEGDKVLMKTLRRAHNKPWRLVVNKAEDMHGEIAMADFQTLGARNTSIVSAKSGAGIAELREQLQAWMQPIDTANASNANPAATTNNEDSKENFIPNIAIIGRPNVGKSTFINRLLNDERMVVSEHAGTTRDCVASELRHSAGTFVLYDTAGMRRARATEEREKLSVSKTRQLLQQVDGCLLLFDICEGITHQDKRIAALAESAGCVITPIANKMDLLPARMGEQRLKQLTTTLLPTTLHQPFLISASDKHSKKPLPTRALLKSLRANIKRLYTPISTNRLNNALQRIVEDHPPPRAARIRPKLRYAHQGSRRPFTIVIHGNAINRIPASYKRYLTTAFAQEFHLVGIPLHIILKGDQNPYT